MNIQAVAGMDDAESLFQDGFGSRSMVVDPTTGHTLEALRLGPHLTAEPSVEFALRERTARLAFFRHASYARVQRIQQLAGSVTVLSEHVPGVRLSELLRTSAGGVAPQIGYALGLVRQLTGAVVVLHESTADVAHGALGPERLVVGEDGRLVVVEYVFGSAVERLEYSREQLWRRLRVALPPAAGLLRCDTRADITQIGVVALALILGRLITSDEYPARVPQLLDGACEASLHGGRRPLSASLRRWLERALQLDTRRSFLSARETLVEFDQVLQRDGYRDVPVALPPGVAPEPASVTVHPASGPKASR